MRWIQSKPVVLLFFLMFWSAVFLPGCGAKKTAVPSVKWTADLNRSRLDSASQLDVIFNHPDFQNAFWGVLVQSMDSGEIIYRQNAEKLFMPASNMKLITAAAALLRLGKEYRFKTRLMALGTINEGTLEGNLLVEGSGDPTIASRFHPNDLFEVFRAWAVKLKSTGIREIRGDIIGDDDAFEDTPLGYGWSWGDVGYGYSAEIGALQFNENAVEIRVSPAAEVNQKAIAEIYPSTGFVQLEVEALTSGKGEGSDLSISRNMGENRIRLGGHIALGKAPAKVEAAIHNPTLYFVGALRQALEKEGIHVGGTALDIDDLPEKPDKRKAAVLLIHESPALEVILNVLLKESQNLYAETLVRILGWEEYGQGTFNAGRRVVQEVLRRMAIPDSFYVMMDGSGLSRYSFLTPDSLLRLFRALYHKPEFSVFFQALPIGGVDGTLRQRMKGSYAENNVHAKTGTIANVRSLSGFVRTQDGEMLGFSMIANHFNASSRQAEYLQDVAVEILAHSSRSTRMAGKEKE